MAERLDLQLSDAGVVLKIWAKPRASRSKLVGIHDGALAVALAAPPVDGAANAELLKTLAKALQLPRSKLALLRGEASKHKQICVQGLGVEGLRQRLQAVLDAGH